MKRSSVDEQLKALQTEANQAHNEACSLVKEEWRWMHSQKGRDAIWESVRRDVLPQGTLAQWLFKAFRRDKSSRRCGGSSDGRVAGNLVSSTLLSKMFPSSMVKYAPLILELFDLARPILISTGITLGRSLVSRMLARLNPFRRKKKKA